jgi:peroxiredoxin
VASKEKESDLIKHMNEFNIPFPILNDADGSVANTYGVRSLPETFFINREGKIVGRALKETDWTSNNMTFFVQQLLKEKK